MKIIDTHVHFSSYPNIKDNYKALLNISKKYNIDFSLISSVDVASYPNEGMPDYKKTTLEGALDILPLVKKYPKKFGLAIWFAPTREVPTLELIDFIRKNRKYIYALKFHPFMERLEISNKLLGPWLILARQEKLPVLVHTAADIYSDIKNVEIAAKDHPKVVFIAAHCQLMGDNMDSYDIIKNNPNIYADTAWVPASFAEKVIKEISPDKLMFGSDSPVDGVDTLGNKMYKPYFEHSLNITDDEYQKLMYLNAKEVYKIKI
ncbi:MAG: amidohydrolase family protein [Bacilli bacterium]|nr:amidohydrolase family protein [Bacilli bacterium]MDY6430916.1 amidohydrolase family protein [Bacilli bacterium]